MRGRRRQPQTSSCLVVLELRPLSSLQQQTISDCHRFAVYKTKFTINSWHPLPIPLKLFFYKSQGDCLKRTEVWKKKLSEIQVWPLQWWANLASDYSSASKGLQGSSLDTEQTNWYTHTQALRFASVWLSSHRQTRQTHWWIHWPSREALFVTASENCTDAPRVDSVQYITQYTLHTSTSAGQVWWLK